MSSRSRAGHSSDHKPFKKNDLRSPDLMTMELKKGFLWTRTHARLTVFVLVLFLLGGLVYSGIQYWNEHIEVLAQNEFYKLETEYLQLQNPQKTSNSVGDKSPVDYKPVELKLTSLVEKYAGSHAGIMAFLRLTDIKGKLDDSTSMEDLRKNSEELVKVADHLKLKKDMLSALALMRKGALLANMQACEQAVSVWGKVLEIKEAEVLYPEIRLQQALCYERLGSFKLSEDNYNKILAEAKDTTTAKSAEKYLRLLKTKMNGAAKAAL